MQQNISNIPVYNQKSYVPSQANPSFTSDTAASNGAALENNPILKHAGKAKENNGGGFAANAVIASAGLFGVNEFLNRGLQGDYDKSFLKKIETWVDKNSTGPKTQKVLKYMSDKVTALKTKLNKSEIFNTLTKKQSLGGPTVQQQAAGARGHLATRAVEVMRKYKEAHPGFTEFDAILTKAGKESYKHIDEIIETINKPGIAKDMFFKKKTWWSLGLLKNKSNLQEIINKDTLIRGYKGIKKAGEANPTLGRKVAGYLMRGTECLTNGMFGGLGQVLFQAFMIAQSLQEARKAEKGEKVSTFAASLFELMAFIGTIGIQMRVVNGLAGLKFTGWSAAQHSAYQSAMKAINEAAKAGDATAYNAGKAALQGIKAGVKSSTKLTFIQKIAKGIGNLVSFGRLNEMVKPLKTGTAAGALKKIPWGVKFGLGYAGRVALTMGVVVPIFSTIAKNVAYGIFGKPKKTLAREKAKAEEEKKAAQNPQEQNPNNPAQPQAMPPVLPANDGQTPSNLPPAKPGDLVAQMNNPNKPQNPMGAQTMSPSTNPTAAAAIKSPDAGIKRTYIPNPILGTEKPIANSEARNAKVDQVMRQADFAEAQAQKYI